MDVVAVAIVVVVVDVVVVVVVVVVVAVVECGVSRSAGCFRPVAVCSGDPSTGKDGCRVLSLLLGILLLLF